MIYRENNEVSCSFLIKMAIATMLMSNYTCNAMKNERLKKGAKIAVIGTTGGWAAHTLKDQYSEESNKSRVHEYMRTLEQHPEVTSSIKRVNETINTELKENIRFYSLVSFLFDKNFVNLSSKKNKLKSCNNKAIKKILEPTIDKVKDVIGGAALVAGPVMGTLLAIKAKKISKDPHTLIPKLLQRTLGYGVGGGVATSVMTDYIDNNPEKVINFTSSLYKKNEQLFLTETQAMCRNGLQNFKKALKGNNNPLHLFIKERPLKETQFFITNDKVIQEACANYYKDVMEGLTRNFFKIPNFLNMKNAVIMNHNTPRKNPQEILKQITHMKKKSMKSLKNKIQEKTL